MCFTAQSIEHRVCVCARVCVCVCVCVHLNALTVDARDQEATE